MNFDDNTQAMWVIAAGVFIGGMLLDAVKLALNENYKVYALVFVPLFAIVTAFNRWVF